MLGGPVGMAGYHLHGDVISAALFLENRGSHWDNSLVTVERATWTCMSWAGQARSTLSSLLFPCSLSL